VTFAETLTAGAGPAKDGLAMQSRRQRGFGAIEILIALLIVGVIVGVVLKQYMSSTARSIEQFQEQKPIAFGKVTADQATLGTVRTALDLYRAQHEQWPADKAAVLALLPSPPRFQCPGNDFEYDAGTGSIRLLIQDSARC
jgi:prepilin-type N-terminal cleavage/methylation domain-containing protein